MKREPVESSTIASIGYDAESETLEVEFHSGKVYEYDNVPPDVYEGLMKADSKDSYMQDCIINMYSYGLVRRRL